MNDPRPAPIAVRHHQTASRFEAEIDGGLAFAQYRREGDTLAVTHTEVPPQAQGRGVAALVVQALLDHARAEGLKVRPLCSYVVAYMRRHRETQDLLAP